MCCIDNKKHLYLRTKKLTTSVRGDLFGDLDSENQGPDTRAAKLSCLYMVLYNFDGEYNSDYSDIAVIVCFMFPQSPRSCAEVISLGFTKRKLLIVRRFT